MTNGPLYKIAVLVQASHRTLVAAGAGKNRLLRHFAASAVAWMAPECGPEDAVWAFAWGHELQESPETYDFLWF